MLFELADMVLGIELEPELGDKVELGLEKIDVLFLVMHQLLEQVARHVILHAVAMSGGLLVEQARRYFGAEVAIEDLLDVLADMQRVEHLQVGKTVEENDALDQLVGVLHLLDRFLAPLLGERLVAPIVEQPVMQPVLVDCRQFVPQRLIEEVEDSRIAFHDRAPAMGVGAARCVAQALIITIKSYPAIGRAKSVEASLWKAVAIGGEFRAGSGRRRSSPPAPQWPAPR